MFSDADGYRSYPSERDDDWDDRPCNPTGETITVEDEDSPTGERVLTVVSADYEPADPSVGIMSGGWYGTLDDGRDVTFHDDGEVLDDKGRRIGKLD